MTAPAAPRSLIWMGTALLLATAALAAQLLQRPGVLLELPLYDYVAFWSAGRIRSPCATTIWFSSKGEKL